MPDLELPDAPIQAPEQPAGQAPEQAPAPKKKTRTAAEKKKLVKRIVAGVTAAAVLGGIIFGLWFLVFREDDSLGDIYAEPAYIGSIQSTVQGSGNATAKETATVTIPANGTVEQVLVSQGDIVFAGQPLFSVYSQAAEDALATAQQQMNSLNEKLDNLTLRAPFSGKLLDVTEFSPGDNVGEGSTVATLVNDTRLKLSLYFSYAYDGEIWVGQTAQVSVPAVMYTGTGTVEQVNKVSFITPEGGIYFEVVIAFDNPGTLTAEMEASAVLTGGDGLPIYPYEQSKTQYYESRSLVTRAGGPLVSSNLLNHARVSAGEALLTMSSESLDEQLIAARERLDEAQANLDALNAAAPIDGTIISCTIAEGSEVKAGDAVITIQNTTTMTVTIQVDDQNIGFIKLGDTVELSNYSGGFYIGTVTNIEMQGEVGQGMSTFPVTLEVDNYDGSLYAGVWLDYSFVTSQSDNCVLVPTTAVKSVLDVNGEKQTVVFVQRPEQPENYVELDPSITGVPGPEDGYWPVLVETGIPDPKVVEIVSGVEDGDMVFISYMTDQGYGYY
ncbi:MAG: HlyD family efflux transporter periplasmic adaptor subunit [Clostridiales bacterium]|nr:HlyD family efflux transporter periplasmic adaptor subunit [Clostridiales bacterium]